MSDFSADPAPQADLLAPGAMTPGGEPEGAEAPPSLTALSFVLGGQVFAVDVHHVREIVDLADIAPLPNAPHDVLGITDLRGQSIVIVDLAARLGTRAEPADDARIVVFEFGSPRGPASLGVVAERVLRVSDVPPEAIESVPDTLSGWRCEAATALARTDDGVALLLDIERILCRDDAPGPFDFG